MNLFSLLLALCSVGDIDVTLRDDGFLYPVTIEIDGGDGAKSQATWYGAKDQVVTRLKPGNYTISARNHRLGFPQPVEYAIGNGEITSYVSGVTIDPKRVELKEGTTLSIRVLEPLSSYNMRRVYLPKVKTYGLITGARPYWYQSIGVGQFDPKAPEAYPNGILFLSDPAWGIEKVAADLAEKAYAGIHADKIETYDHRGTCHWTYMHVVDPTTTDEKLTVPPALLTVTKEEFKQAFADTFRAMLAHNCYRPFPPQEVAALRNAGLLPVETPVNKPLVLTLGQGVEYGKKVLPAWKIQRAQELEALKK